MLTIHRDILSVYDMVLKITSCDESIMYSMAKMNLTFNEVLAFSPFML